MGQLVIIKAKENVDLEKLNAALKKAGIKNSFTTEEDNLSWLQDINHNPKSSQAHLKPKDRDLTMDELKEMFTLWTEVGTLYFDVAYSRTSQEEAVKYAAFISKHKDDILNIQDGDELIERYNLTAEYAAVITSLNTKPEEPELLPVEEQTYPDLQGGLYLCKSFSIKPFWLVFGNVETPTFLKIKKYKDSFHDNIYYDKQGYAYLLIPLLPLNDKQLSFVERVYDRAFQIGLRENFNFIIPIIYGLDSTNYFETAKDYREDYTQEELRERFWTLFRYTDSVFKYGMSRGFRWSDAQKRFKPIGDSTTTLQSKCSVLTCLLWAMGEKAAAELMSNLTGKPYKTFEFGMPKSHKVNP